jgi:hypothetical protein
VGLWVAEFEALIPPAGLSCSVKAPAFPSRPESPGAMGRNAGEERSGAARSHAQRALQREHGEDGEHRTFSGVSTMAHSAPAGWPGHQMTSAAGRRASVCCAATMASTRASSVFSSTAASGTG